MDWRSAIRLGIQGLLVHKVRAGLSMLGIIFGVASVVAVIAVSVGARGEMLKQLAALGANNIIVSGIDWRTADAKQRELKLGVRLLSPGLTLRTATAVAQTSNLFAAHAPVRKVSAAVRRGETPISSEVVGTSPSFLSVMNFKLREGRWLNAADETDARRVCVIEETVRHEAFRSESALTRSVFIDHEPYEVIGVLASKEVTENKYEVVDVKKLNRRIYIPLSCSWQRTTREPLADELQEVIYQCRDANDIYPAAALLRRHFEAAHNMQNRPDEEHDFKVLVAKDLLDSIEKTQDIFNVVMLSSAGISLLVGGIGIMNIMLANVTERRREVGLRRAVGATQADILKQFLFESLAICLAGGLLGCALGVVFTYLVSERTQWQTSLEPWSMFVAVGVSLLDGVCFGTYPAWKAAKLDPIEALRYE